MKIIFGLILVFIINYKGAAAEEFSLFSKGSFLLLKPTYLYENTNFKGKKIYTQRKLVLKVIGLCGEELMIEYPRLKKSINGTGYVIKNNFKSAVNQNTLIKVYPSIKQEKQGFLEYLEIPLNQLSLTGEEIISAESNLIKWQTVNYKTRISRTFCIKKHSGIYRPDKTVEWLQKTYHKVMKIKYPLAKKIKILEGLIEPKFKMKDVELSLGTANKENILLEDQVEWIYEDKKIIFKNNLVQHSIPLI